MEFEARQRKFRLKFPWAELESRLEQFLGQVVVNFWKEGEVVVVQAEFFDRVDQETVKDQIKRFLCRYDFGFLVPHRIEIICPRSISDLSRAMSTVEPAQK